MKCGWLSPHGEFVECEPWEHWHKAHEIVKGAINPDEDLLDKGWIKIGDNNGWHRIDMTSDYATDQQKLFLENFYRETSTERWETQGLRNLYYCGIIDESIPW